MQAVVWSKNGCPYCDRAKELLGGSGIKYEEHNISDSDELRTQLLETLEKVAPDSPKTVPQIFLDGEYVGGYRELCQYYEDHDMFRGNPGL
jgi:thioredoxin reductase (NADPH)